jgi:cob(I)alamin adenosyltransferase
VSKALAKAQVSPERVAVLEAAIDRVDAALAPLSAFILPGGTMKAALLHVARTVCRRAERSVVSLAAEQPVPPELLAYLNRLSDLLFTLARLANHRAGAAEHPW